MSTDLEAGKLYVFRKLARYQSKSRKRHIVRATRREFRVPRDGPGIGLELTTVCGKPVPKAHEIATLVEFDHDEYGFSDDCLTCEKLLNQNG